MADTTNRNDREGPTKNPLTPEQLSALTLAIGEANSRGEKIDVDSYIALAKAQTETDKPSSSSTSYSLPTLLNRAASDALIKEAMLTTLGVVPDKKILDDFYKRATAFLKQYGSTSSTRSGNNTSKTQQIQGVDANTFVQEYVGAYTAKLATVNPNIKFGGEVGKAQQALSDYSNEMGLFKSAREVASTAVGIASKKLNADDVIARYRTDAQVLYKNFADRLKQDSKLTVRDLVNPYIQMMADTWETTADTIKLTDNTIQKAVNGDSLMSLGDFRTLLRSNPKFETTYGAKTEAAQLGEALLRSFSGRGA